MIIVHVVEPFAAGVAVFVRSLTEAMPNDVHIIVHGERRHVMPAEEVKRSFPQKNVRFIKWRSAQRSIHPLKDFRALGELYKMLRRLRKKNLVDAVHLHSSKSGFLGRIASRMAGIDNVVYTPNGAPFLSGNQWTNYWYQRLERFGNRLGGQVICCSASEGEQYRKIGVNALFINNGITLDQTSEEPQKRKPNDKFRIITAGRIVTQKDPVLFNAIASYFEDFPQFEFVWAGDGEERPQLKASNIRVTGWLSPAEAKEEIFHSDIFLSTSVYEGLSFAVLEAQALKKPVLLNDCVGNSDVVKSGVNGDIFKNENEAVVKILRYFNNRDMMDVMGEYAFNICSAEFDMQRNFQVYQDAYKGARHATDKGVAWSTDKPQS